MLHRVLRPTNCSQSQRLSKDSVWNWFEAPIWGTIGKRCVAVACPAGHATPLDGITR